MATGERPFRGDNSASVISAVLKDQPLSVTDLKGDLRYHFRRLARQLASGNQTFDTTLDGSIVIPLTEPSDVRTRVVLIWKP